MKNILNKISFAFILFLLSHINSIAQAQSQPEMADIMYANGKIYVVVGVLVIILSGIFIYLFALDRKITSIEKRLK